MSPSPVRVRSIVAELAGLRHRIATWVAHNLRSREPVPVSMEVLQAMQQELWATRESPRSLSLEVIAQVESQDASRVICNVIGHRGSILLHKEETFEGVELDMVPTLCENLLMAYLYGEYPRSVSTAWKQGRDSAKAHARKHRRIGF